MSQSNLTTTIRRPAPNVAVIDINGEVSGFAESILSDAYNEASEGNTRTILFNFSGLEYMNSSGIGLLVTLLIRSQRQKQRLLACGLSEHYEQIFELTRLNEAIGIYKTEQDAILSG